MNTGTDQQVQMHAVNYIHKTTAAREMTFKDAYTFLHHDMILYVKSNVYDLCGT